MSKPIKLFISTPCYGGLCLEKYMISLIKLQVLLIRENIQMMLDTTENESLVHRARNVSLGRFMQKTDADYFMFIDADVEFDPTSVVRLVKSGHDVSVSVYPKRSSCGIRLRMQLQVGIHVILPLHHLHSL